MAKPNIKALAIDHGEKIVFGLFAVIVLAVLGTTSWARYSKSPDELKKNVTNARNKISAPDNVWPKADQEAFKIVDYSERSRLLFTPLASIANGRFDYSTPLYHPLYRKDEPRREPVFEAVQYLIANSGLAPLSMAAAPQTDVPVTEPKSTPDEEMADPKMDDDEFQKRPEVSTAVGTGRPGAPAMPAQSHGGGPPGGPPRGQGAAPGRGPMAGAAGAAIFAGMPMPGGVSSGLGAMGPEVKALGVRYIAVRGVFPLAKQIENYKKALHLQHSDAANLVEIADFVLERQAATSNIENPWKDAKWIQVSLARAEEILDECSDLDPLDPVPTALKDPVITMPLPLRLLFTWGPAATHPKIKGWELKKEEIDVEDKLIEALTQAASEANVQEPAKERQRGLAGKQRDVKGLAKTAANNSDMMSMMKSMYGQMGAAGAGPNGGNAASPPRAMAMPKMPGAGGGHAPAMPSMPMSMPMAGMGAMRPGNTSMDRLVVNAQYLLFRYLDFDVEPGMAYRYRVRLQLRNPNFDLSPEELGSAEPEIAKGDERGTPWSNISNPEVVPSTVNFYLKHVDREPYAEEKVRNNTSKSVAQLSMFDWDTKLGTIVNDVLNIWSIGAFVGDEKKRDTLKLDLAAGILDKDKEFKFSTMNVLLDVEADVEVDVAQHPDLKLAGADKRGVARVGLVPEALVAMESGEVELLDPYSERDEEQKWLRQKERERDGFVEGKPKTPSNRLDALAAKDADKEGDKPDKKKRKRNPRRSDPTNTAGGPPGAAGGTAAYADMMQKMMQSPGASQPTTNAKKKK